MRFANIPKKLPDLQEGAEPMTAHMLHGVTTGIVGGVIREQDVASVHVSLYALVHHLAGIVGFVFPQEDDERFLVAMNALMREKIKAAREAKVAGHEYCPEEMLPMRMERIGSRKRNPTKGEEHETPANPEAAAASERVAGTFIDRLRKGG